MKLIPLPHALSVCKVADLDGFDLQSRFWFLARTADELSLVCRTEDAPEATLAREDGWRGFYIDGELDFSLVGILAKITAVLADAQIGVFAVSTYNTDYVLVKEANFTRALAALAQAGYGIVPLTTVYFVRHAKPDHSLRRDEQRPLSAEGLQDRLAALDFLKDKPVDAVYSSPYPRSYDTVAPAAEHFCLPIQTDDRLRERQPGPGGNTRELMQRRWADHDFHEEGGECLRSVQKRNVAALFDILDANPGRTLVIGTHGTALSTILHYFDPSFGFEGFWRIIDWMPYVIELTFSGRKLIGKRDCLHVYKEYKP